MPAVYKADYKGIGEMLRSPGIRGAVSARARRVRAAAEAIAPVGSPADGDDTPGTFKGSFRVSVHVRADANGRGSRVVADVVSVDPLGAKKELGHVASNGRYVDGSHTLLRALDAARL